MAIKRDPLVPRASQPIGASLCLEALAQDPYPIYRRLQESEPISWVPALNMWLVTRYDDVREILADDLRFTTAFQTSLIRETFGEQVLTSEGDLHRVYRRAFQPLLQPARLRQYLEEQIRAAATALVDTSARGGGFDVRTALASRLPVQVMLLLFGLPIEGEQAVRRWYDDFERALSNFEREPGISARARDSRQAFDQFLSESRVRAGSASNASPLPSPLALLPENALSEEAIRNNIAIIFFGGISTVEALILDAAWALATHPAALDRVSRDRQWLGKAIEETIRWIGPVQSATREVVADMQFQGMELRKGDVVNCMLAAANRDPRIFPEPDRFDLDRSGLARHLGFATGPHSCMGFHLAKMEAAISLNVLLDRFGAFKLSAPEECVPCGYEFRQPRRLLIESASAGAAPTS